MIIETTVSALIVATLSGLAFLAYKHHEGFKLIVTPLVIADFIAYAAFQSYKIGYSNGVYATEIEKVAFSNDTTMLWAAGIFATFYIYIMILTLLMPKIAKKED